MHELSSEPWHGFTAWVCRPAPEATWTTEPAPWATVRSGHGPDSEREQELPWAEPKERAWGTAASTSESSAAPASPDTAIRERTSRTRTPRRGRGRPVPLVAVDPRHPTVGRGPPGAGEHPRRVARRPRPGPARGAGGGPPPARCHPGAGRVDLVVMYRELDAPVA